jgi:hypothetical protein
MTQEPEPDTFENEFSESLRGLHGAAFDDPSSDPVDGDAMAGSNLGRRDTDRGRAPSGGTRGPAGLFEENASMLDAIAGDRIGALLHRVERLIDDVAAPAIVERHADGLRQQRHDARRLSGASRRGLRIVRGRAGIELPDGNVGGRVDPIEGGGRHRDDRIEAQEMCDDQSEQIVPIVRREAERPGGQGRFDIPLMLGQQQTGESHCLCRVAADCAAKEFAQEKEVSKIAGLVEVVFTQFPEDPASAGLLFVRPAVLSTSSIPRPNSCGTGILRSWPQSFERQIG